ncbi:MAG TPA: DUF1592 domain-containing protein [Alphaproteobacteria bacterium]|nr:DUF1592 domain-containing protein [Alphaproteobacteria bacterium]
MRSVLTATALVLGVLGMTSTGAAFAASAGSNASGDTGSSPQQTVADKQFKMLDDYCVKCHNYKDWKGQIAFDTMTPDGIPQDAAIWEKAIGRLSGELMPPPGKPRPDQKQIESFISWLEGQLDAAGAKKPDPGHVTLHRLNREEYAKEIKSLFGLDVDVESLLPKDTETDGFDNVAASLQVSPSFMEQYVTAARKVTQEAVGDPKPTPRFESISTPDNSNFSAHVEGLPLGTRGGVLYKHYFPAGGDYVFNIQVASPNGYFMRSHWLEYPNTLIMTVDGDRVFEGHVGGDADRKAVDMHLTPAVTKILGRFKKIHVKIPAGKHRIGITWVAKTFAESDLGLQQFNPEEGVFSLPKVRGFQYVGPYDTTGVGQTVSRKKIFTCHPSATDKQEACAHKILARIATDAFRRPVTSKDMAVLMRFYDSGAKEGGFEVGVQKGLMAMLASPHFLYRAELPPQNAKPGSIYEVSDLALASRLSFFLWSQGPDKELLKLAEEHKLHDPKVLSAQVDRMLADPRAESLVTNFAFQWLEIGQMDTIKPDTKIFPNFNPELRAAFVKEIKLFLDSILLKNKSVLDLINADYTFLNERLARHYGIQSVRGNQFRRVKLTDPNRYGLFGKAAILMLSSYPNRTSPVLRGAWILDNIFGTPPTAPPPNVPPFPETQEGEKALSVRARLEEHRKNPSCNFCHGVIDPLGLSLENYDATGEWRTIDRFAGTPIDASGQMVDGTKLNGPVDLQKVVLGKPDQFAQTITRKLMIYALGRTLDYHDMPVVRSIVRQAAADNYRFGDLVEGIVHSDAFQKKTLLTAGKDKSTKEASVK